MDTLNPTTTGAAVWPADRAATRPVIAALAVLLAFGLFALAGCGEGIAGTAPEGLDDDAELREFMEEDGIFDDLGMYGGDSVALGTDGREVIDPLTFWRVITDREVNRTVAIDTLAGTAEATIDRDVWGELHILTEEMDEIVKPFHHAGLRYANFARIEDPGDDEHGGEGEGGDGNGEYNGEGSGENERHRYRHGRWELTEISGFRAQSDTLTLSIDWIRVQGDSVDVTITDPLELMAVPDEIMLLDVGEEITVTVSGPPADAILFLHTRHQHSPLTYDGASFTGTWTVERPGRKCAWVTALSYETLHDSEYPDDWMAWGMPYEVAADEVGGQ